MPTYEYICSKCGDQFDVVQSIKDDALTICPKEKCKQTKWGKGKVKRAIGAGAGLIFKGSGFYITDYRSENYKAGAKKEPGATASAAEPASTAAGGKDPKPAPKPDSKPATPAAPPAKSEGGKSGGGSKTQS